MKLLILTLDKENYNQYIFIDMNVYLYIGIQLNIISKKNLLVFLQYIK